MWTNEHIKQRKTKGRKLKMGSYSSSGESFQIDGSWSQSMGEYSSSKFSTNPSSDGTRSIYSAESRLSFPEVSYVSIRFILYYL